MRNRTVINGQLMTLLCIRLLGYILTLSICTAAITAPKALGASIGVVFDGPSEINQRTLSVYEKEIKDLTAGEFTVSFPGQDNNRGLDSPGVRSALERQLSTRPSI
ncbi:MAG: hypothetical protein R3B51_02590 [Thermodesulfobacteriota bacterium]